jgi:hypothetical protein
VVGPDPQGGHVVNIDGQQYSGVSSLAGMHSPGEGVQVGFFKSAALKDPFILSSATQTLTQIPPWYTTNALPPGRISWPQHEGQPECGEQGIVALTSGYVPVSFAPNGAEPTPSPAMGILLELLAGVDAASGLPCWFETFANQSGANGILALREVVLNGAELLRVTFSSTIPLVSGGPEEFEATSRHAWLIPGENLLFVATPPWTVIDPTALPGYWIYNTATAAVYSGTVARSSFLGAAVCGPYVVIDSYEYTYGGGGTFTLGPDPRVLSSGNKDGFTRQPDNTLALTWSIDPRSLSVLTGTKIPLTCAPGAYPGPGPQNMLGQERFPFSQATGTYWSWCSNRTVLADTTLAPFQIADADWHLVGIDPASGALQAHYHGEVVSAALPVLVDANSFSLIESLTPFSGLGIGDFVLGYFVLPGSTFNGGITTFDVAETLASPGYTITYTAMGWRTSEGTISGGAATSPASAADIASPGFEARYTNIPGGGGPWAPAAGETGTSESPSWVYGPIQLRWIDFGPTLCPLLAANTQVATLTGGVVTDNTLVRFFPGQAGFTIFPEDVNDHAVPIDGPLNMIPQTWILHQAGLACDALGAVYAVQVVPESILLVGFNAYQFGIQSARANLENEPYGAPGDPAGGGWHTTDPTTGLPVVWVNGYETVPNPLGGTMGTSTPRIVEEVVYWREPIRCELHQTQLVIGNITGVQTITDISQRFAGDIWSSLTGIPAASYTPGTVLYPLVDQVWQVVPVVWADSTGTQHVVAGVLRDMRLSLNQESRPVVEFYTIDPSTLTATLLGMIDLCQTGMDSHSIQYLYDNRNDNPVLKADYASDGSPFFSGWVFSQLRSSLALSVRNTMIPILLDGSAVGTPIVTEYPPGTPLGPANNLQAQLMRFVNGQVCWPASSGQIQYAT